MCVYIYIYIYIFYYLFSIQHTERIFHDISGHVRHQDSGYWLMNLDRHSPDSVSSLIPEVAKAETVKHMCEKELACGLPHFTARSLQIR